MDLHMMCSLLVQDISKRFTEVPVAVVERALLTKNSDWKLKNPCIFDSHD